MISGIIAVVICNNFLPPNPISKANFQKNLSRIDITWFRDVRFFFDFVITLQAKTVHGQGSYTQLQLQLINLALKVFNTGWEVSLLCYYWSMCPQTTVVPEHIVVCTDDLAGNYTEEVCVTCDINYCMCSSSVGRD